MPISYGDGGGPPSDDDTENKKAGASGRLRDFIERTEADKLAGNMVGESTESEWYGTEPVDPQADPLKAFITQPVVDGGETAGPKDRLGHIVDLTPRDLDSLTFDEEDAVGVDHEGDDFTPG